VRVARVEDRFLLHALEFESVLRACLWRYTHNNSDVDELLQETYARLLVVGASQQQTEVRSIRAFCLTVARNVALDWLRRQQVVPLELVSDMESLDVLDEGAQIEEIVNAHQELALLADAIASMPRRCRQTFTLRKVYGFSQKEIAAQLNISENTVEQHLTKAARRCAEVLFESPLSPRRRERWLPRMRRRAKSYDERE
jgi:RNA polymerase sigma factor (sigma-70 family)